MADLVESYVDAGRQGRAVNSAGDKSLELYGLAFVLVASAFELARFFVETVFSREQIIGSYLHVDTSKYFGAALF